MSEAEIAIVVIGAMLAVVFIAIIFGIIHDVIEDNKKNRGKKRITRWKEIEQRNKIVF